MLPWLRRFLPLATLIFAVVYGFGVFDARHETGNLVSHEQTSLDLAGARLSQQIADSVDDVRLMRDTPAIRRFVEKRDAATQAQVEELFGAFVRGKAHYATLRLIDTHGMEVVRVDRSVDGAQSYPSDQLQDRHLNDYVVETLALPPGRVRVSHMDLAVEHGQIEKPIKPILRLSVRLGVGTSGADYLLVANLRGAVLLKAVEEVLQSGAGVPWLMDREGYWLIHPDPAMAWGFVLDPARRLSQLRPELGSLLELDRGSLRTPDGLFVHRRLDVLVPEMQAGLINAAPRFILVSRIPPRKLPTNLPAGLLWTLVVLLLFAALGCAVEVRTRARAMGAEQRERRLLEAQSAADAQRLWVSERIYQLSLKMHAASDAASLARTLLSEIAPTLGLAAGCLYALRESRAEPLGSFGLSDSQLPREFAIGEGLVGEAARTREERRLTPPPAGYLDLVGGAGSGPAADLRVLPLWVHGRSVGVLELAFIDRLDARPEEFLRQLLPLLALNLDSWAQASRRTA